MWAPHTFGHLQNQPASNPTPQDKSESPSHPDPQDSAPQHCEHVRISRELPQGDLRCWSCAATWRMSETGFYDRVPIRWYALQQPNTSLVERSIPLGPRAWLDKILLQDSEEDREALREAMRLMYANDGCQADQSSDYHSLGQAREQAESSEASEPPETF